MNDDRQAKAEQPREGADMKAWVAGEVAGTGMFRCTSCGNSVAVEAVDELPSCPSCGGVEFIRASLFTTAQNDLVELRSDVVDPGWIEELRPLTGSRPGSHRSGVDACAVPARSLGAIPSYRKQGDQSKVQRDGLQSCRSRPDWR